MGTSDVLKVLKNARAVGECNLRTFKTSRVTINHEMHEQVHTIFYLLYSQQNYRYSNALLCRRYVIHKTLQWFPICSRFIWTNQKYNVVTGKSSVKFLKDFDKIQKISRKLNFQLLKVEVRKSVFNSLISIGLSDLQTLVSCIVPKPR